MRKTALFIIIALLLTIRAFAAYPSSGAKAPSGSELITGEIIGEEIGWDGSANTGRAAAFDGDIYTYYDPTQYGGEGCWAGIKAEKEYILTLARIMPRDGQLTRYEGAVIQGSNDGAEWTTLWQSGEPAYEFEWQTVNDFENNDGYQYFRYFNAVNHGDVAELELYGYAAAGGPDTAVIREGYLKVSFDLNGGEGEAAPVEAAFGELYPALPDGAVMQGYVFGGWYTSRYGGVKVTAEKIVTSPEDHTLYARWLTPEQAEEEQRIADEQSKAEESKSNASGNDPVPAICAVISAAAIIVSAVYIIIKRKPKKSA